MAAIQIRIIAFKADGQLVGAVGLVVECEVLGVVVGLWYAQRQRVTIDGGADSDRVVFWL